MKTQIKRTANIAVTAGLCASLTLGGFPLHAIAEEVSVGFDALASQEEGSATAKADASPVEEEAPVAPTAPAAVEAPSDSAMVPANDPAEEPGDTSSEEGSPKAVPAQQAEGVAFKGAGTAQDPYQIASAADFELLAKKINDGEAGFASATYKQIANIDLAGVDWAPIGTDANRFTGTFIGTGFTVSNLTVNKPDANNVGLFGYIASPAQLVDITINNATVAGKSDVGALVGAAFTGSIKGCKVTGALKVTGNYKVGGLAGGGYANMEGCSVAAAPGSSVTGVYVKDDLEGDNVGGLVGFRGEGDTLTSGCSVSGLTVAGSRKVGGLIGSVFTNNRVEGCSVSSVAVASNASNEYGSNLRNKGTMGVGGLVGLYTINGGDKGTLKNCTASNIKLSVLDAELAKKNTVVLGYVSGGLRGLFSPGNPDSKVAAENVAVKGYNTGANGDQKIPGSQLVSGSTVERVVAQVVDAKGAVLSGYGTLNEAVAAATSGQTVKLTADVTLEGLKSDARYGLDVNAGITIDGDGHTIDCGTAARGIRVVGSDDKASPNVITFKNVTIVNKNASGRGIDTRGGYFDLTLDGVKIETTGTDNNQPLTIGGDHSDLDAEWLAPVTITGKSKLSAGNAGYGITTFNPVDLTVTGESELSGFAAIYVKGPLGSKGSRGSKILLTGNAVATGTNVYDGGQNGFGTIVLEDGDIAVTVDGATVKAVAQGKETQTAFQTSSAEGVGGGSVTITGDSNVILEGESAQFAGNDKDRTSIEVSGGSFNFELPEGYLAEGYDLLEKDENGNYVVHKHSLTFVAEVPATVDAPGKKAHYACSACGDLFWDAEGTRPVLDKTDLVIDRLPAGQGGTATPGSTAKPGSSAKPGSTTNPGKADKLAQTGDASMFAVAASGLAGAVAVAAGSRKRRRS